MAAPARPTGLHIAASWITLAVSEAVSGLQFNIVTTGTMMLLAGAKYFDYVSTGSNTYKVMVFVTTNTTFTGAFLGVANGTIGAISNVMASDIDGNLIAGVTVS